MRLLLIFLVLLAAASSEAAQEGGGQREQSAPLASIARVFGSAPPMTLLVYVLDGDKLVAVNAPLKNGSNNAEARFLTSHFLKLPVLGGWHGDKQPNLEEILQVHSELIVI